MLYLKYGLQLGLMVEPHTVIRWKLKATILSKWHHLPALFWSSLVKDHFCNKLLRLFVEEHISELSAFIRGMSSTTVVLLRHVLVLNPGSDLWRGRCPQNAVSLWKRGTSSVWLSLSWQPCKTHKRETFPCLQEHHQRLCDLVAKQDRFDCEGLIMILI